MTLSAEIAACRLCAARFANTATAHTPRPVVWFDRRARILIAGQAPGARVHRSGRPFSDPSGDRLRDWLGVGEDVFYDQSKIAIVPMAFCFTGYDAKGSDLPPPKICGDTWHDRVMAQLGKIQLRVLVGGAAQHYHLGRSAGVTQTVQSWRDHAPQSFVLPHPSWRNSGWLNRHPWFATDVLPALKARVKEVLND